MPNNSGAAAARSLFGHKAKPRRELTSVLEGASVADRGDKRSRRHRTDPFDLAETLADLAVAIEWHCHGNVFILVNTCLEVRVETNDSNILGRRSRLLNRPLLT
jgi:hypothetical protein